MLDDRLCLFVAVNHHGILRSNDGFEGATDSRECIGGQDEWPCMATDWRERIRIERARKDEVFGDASSSPIPPDEREEFEGLSYYPVNGDYRFEVQLRDQDETHRVTVGTSTDGNREYVRWGEFHVTVDGERVALQAYRSEPRDDDLWVPFRDATSGDETYGSGRYLDLEPDEHRTDDGKWVLDFNRAYNPTCAYSDLYECPLPPTENWLDVRVEAGERSYR